MEKSVITNTDWSMGKYLISCLMIAAALCTAQILGNRMMVLASLMLQLLLALLAAFRGAASPMLLFFLPWSTLMKLAPGSISFYTLSLILICLIYALRSKANGWCVAGALLLLGLTLPAKILAGGSVTMDYLMFLFLLALFPAVMGECAAGVSGRTLTVFFSLGIISAALTARIFAGYGSIARYIDVDSWAKVVRYSGYYGDANFYSAHVSAALAGVMAQILTEREWKGVFLWVGLAVGLVYCGLMSASKMFAITLGAMGLLWILAMRSTQTWLGFKGMILVGICAGIGVWLGSGLFSDMIDVIAYRFSFSSNLSELSTGRTDLWQKYFLEVFHSPRMLLLGNGYTNLKLNGRASHNTLIQMLFQFGLIGSPVLLGWMKMYVSDGMECCRPRGLPTLIVLVGIFLPWMALDMLFFDEFFLMPLYGSACVLSLTDRTVGEEHKQQYRNKLGENASKEGIWLRQLENSKIRVITLKDLWDLFVRRLMVILLVSAVSATGAMAIVNATYVPAYSSTATLYILRQSDRDSASDTANDFSLALKVVNDCTYLLKSHSVLDEVIRQLGLEMDYEQLYDCIKTTNPSDTRILEVTVTMDSPEKAKQIADALCQVGPKYIARAMGFEQLNLFEYGTLSYTPCNRVGPMNYVLVSITAAVLTYCVFMMRFLLDDRIRSGDDLEQRLGVSILGQIPYTDIQNSGARDDYPSDSPKKQEKKGIPWRKFR